MWATAICTPVTKLNAGTSFASMDLLMWSCKTLRFSSCVISIFPSVVCVVTPTVREIRPASTPNDFTVEAGRDRAASAAVSLENLRPGLVVHMACPASFSGANDNEDTMTKSRKGRSADPRQTDLFSLLEGVIAIPAAPEPRQQAGGLDCDQKTRQILNAAIAAGPFSRREDLAEAISFHAGRRVTKAMLDSWTGASRPHALPASLIPAISAALGNSILLSGVAELSGCAISESADLIRQRLEKLTLIIRFAKAEQRRLIAETPLFQGVRHG